MYQKTIPITKTSTATLTDISSLNIENLVYSTGIEYPADKSLFLTLNYYENSNWYCFIEKIGNDLGIYCSSRDYQSAPYVLATIQYTKTTDVPGSGTYTTMGTPAVHYSTDWHVVGTWWNGKPIYEKTFHFTTENLPADRATIEKIYDFDELVGIDGYFGYQHYSNDFRNYKLGEAPSQLTNKAIYLLCEGNDQVNNIQDLDFNFNGLDRSKVTYISATVRITKTTD